MISNDLDKKFLDLHEFYSNTEYGKLLKSRIRFDRYKPEDVSDQEWERLLGPNVNNLDHTWVVYEDAKKFLSHPDSMEKFTDIERKQMLLTAIVHDWAEAIVGDVTIDYKTKDGKESERKILKDLGLKLISDYNNDEELKKQFLSVIDDVFFNFVTPLGKAFDAVERIGHYQTAVDAWNAAEEMEKQDRHKLALHLKWLTNNVLLNQMYLLLEYEKQFEYIRDVMRKHQNVVDDAFKNHPAEVFNLYPEPEISARVLSFDLAKDLWLATSVTTDRG